MAAEWTRLESGHSEVCCADHDRETPASWHIQEGNIGSNYCDVCRMLIDRVRHYSESDDKPAGVIREQPAPVPNDRPAVWDLVIEDMRARDALGRESYGTPLQAGNGRDALRDAYEEALDLCVYLRQAIEERDVFKGGQRELVYTQESLYNPDFPPTFRPGEARVLSIGWRAADAIGPAGNRMVVDFPTAPPEFPLSAIWQGLPFSLVARGRDDELQAIADLLADDPMTNWYQCLLRLRARIHEHGKISGTEPKATQPSWAEAMMSRQRTRPCDCCGYIDAASPPWAEAMESRL